MNKLINRWRGPNPPRLKRKRDCIAFALEALHDVCRYHSEICQRFDGSDCVAQGEMMVRWCPVCIARYTLDACRKFDV